MRAVMQLARLNDADLALDAIKARLTEIAEALREPESLRVAKAEFAANEAILADRQAAVRLCEERQAEIIAKLAHSENRLYGGQVRNPKELEDAERDVQQLQRQRAQADDAVLEALIGVEEALAKRAALRAPLERLESERIATNGALQAERERLLARYPVARSHQNAMRQLVPPALLQPYEQLRARRGGRAVAELDGDMCSVCRVAVPPGVLEQARYGDQPVYCGNCGRLLWGE